MGFTLGCRPAILAFRSAPVQVNYLSYPGIVGTGHIDYTLVDRFVIPEDQRALFHEPVVYLPDTYLGYDAEQRISERTPLTGSWNSVCPKWGLYSAPTTTPSRSCHRPSTLDVVAEQSPGQRVVAVGNEHHRHGQSAARGHGARHRSRPMCFAPFVKEISDHLARYRLTDLFLDTLPFNAHTTACDALWPACRCSPALARRSSGGWRRVF